jgi:hypothetical protein
MCAAFQKARKMPDNNQQQQPEKPNPWAGFGPNVAMGAANAGLGAIMGIATAGWQDRRQLRQQEALQKMQEAGNMRMADYQQKLAYEMWQKTGYEAQMEQLKNAGLNPALMYAKGGPGGSTTANVSGVSGGNAASGQGEILQGIGLMQKQQEMRMQEAQIKVMESQANKNNVEAGYTGGVGTDLARTQIADLTQGIENKKAQELLTKAQTYLTDINADQAELDLAFANDSYEDRLWTIESNAKQAKWLANKAYEESIQAGVSREIAEKSKEHQLQIIYATAIRGFIQNNLMNAEIANKKADTKLKGAQYDNTVQSTEESKARIREIDSKIKLNDATINNMAGMLAVAQGNMDINEFNADMKAKYQPIWNVAGENFDAFLRMLRGAPKTTDKGKVSDVLYK